MNDSLLSHEGGEWMDFEAEVERIERLSREEVAAALLALGCVPRTRLPWRLRLLRLRYVISYRVSQVSNATVSWTRECRVALARAVVVCGFAWFLFWVPARIYSADGNASANSRTAFIFVDLSANVAAEAVDGERSTVLPSLKTTLAELDAIRAVSLNKDEMPAFSRQWNIRDPEVESFAPYLRKQRMDEVMREFQHWTVVHIATHGAFSTTDLGPLAESLNASDDNVNVLLTDLASEGMVGLPGRPQNVGSRLTVVVLPHRDEVNDPYSQSFTRKMDSWRTTFPGSRVVDGLEGLMASQQSSSKSNEN